MKVTQVEFNPSHSDGINSIKIAGVHLQEVIEEHTPAGRRRALALTHLETALMFAVKAAAVGDDD